MNNTTKTKSLVTIIIFLLITNIAMLIFFIALSKSPDKRQRIHEQNGMYNSLQNDVGFSKDQLDQYQSLRKDQRDKAKPLFIGLRNAKKNFYGLIYNKNIPDSLLNADADSIAQKQKTLDMQMFRYFNSIRNICSPDQLEKFDTIINVQITRMVSWRPGNNRQDHSK